MYEKCIYNWFSESDYNSEVLARKAMVFLIAGVKQRWKLPLGYDLTENSFNHAFIARRIVTIIKLCLKKGIKIRSLVMDGGSTNRTL